MVAFTNLKFIQGAVLFLALTGNERNGTAFLNKADDCANLRHTDVEFLSNFFHDFHFIDLKGVNCFLCKFHRGNFMEKTWARKECRGLDKGKKRHEF